MKQLFLIVYRCYTWLIFFPLTVIFTLLFGSLATILAITTTPRVASYFGGVWWARLLLFFTPVRVKVFGRQKIAPQGSYVIVSNHQSLYDILVIYAWLGLDFRWVMKQELRRIPGLGIGCETIGHIFIDRSNHEKAIATINRAKERLGSGTSVLFFPEGTRQAGKEVGSFKKGAFRLALDLEFPVLPITICGTSKILPPRTWHLKPGSVHLHFHEPISVEGVNTSLDELRERAYNAVNSIKAEQCLTKNCG